MKIQYAGIEIEIETDGDGHPTVKINTGGFEDAVNFRPTVPVILNNVVIHTMFDNDDGEDDRWVK